MRYLVVSPCPECGGLGAVPSLSIGPEEPLWVRCPDCDGTGEHYCGCRIDPGCTAHGGVDSAGGDMTPEVRARLPRRAES